jgi:hypothetical protein
MLVPIGSVVLEINAFMPFFFVHDNSCKKYRLECFFAENICFSKDSRPINFGASRISCFENVCNFARIFI